MTSFELRLYETMVSLCDEKNTIRTLVTSALIDWGFVDPDGSARDVWRSVVEQASQQRKLKELIAVMWDRYHSNQDLAVLHREVDSIPAVRPITQSGLLLLKPWPTRCYERIDRKKQVGAFQKFLPLRAGRASMIVWCGDHMARHDLMYSRMILASVRFPTREVKAEAETTRTFQLDENIADSLNSACQEFFQDDWRKAYLRESHGSGRMIHIQCNMSWDSTTIEKLKQVQDWCEALGDFGSDRCFVVAVAIKVQPATGFLAKFWSKPMAQLIDQAKQQIEQGFAGGKIILLPYLEELSPDHLVTWVSDMTREEGPPPDDRFGEDKLLSWFRSTDTTLPMATVISKVEKLLQSPL